MIFLCTCTLQISLQYTAVPVDASDKGKADDPVELGSVAWSESETPAAEGREKLSLNGSSEGEEEEGRREEEGGRREEEREGGGRVEEREG